MTELSKEELDALVRGTDELMSETSAGEQEALAGHEVRRLEVLMERMRCWLNSPNSLTAGLRWITGSCSLTVWRPGSNWSWVL